MSLSLRKLKKSFRLPDGTILPVIQIPQFDLASGEQVALVGQSGSGKTTLLNLIAGITPPDSGQVLIDQTDLVAMSEARRDRFRAERIGIVFQSFNLLPAFTALENVLLGMTFSGRADRREAARLLQMVGLKDRLGHRPSQLSVGEQQRVAVARALANRPSLMLADEPTANVDVANQQNILDLIRQSSRENQVSLLLITHTPEVSAQFERVVDLKEINRMEAAQ